MFFANFTAYRGFNSGNTSPQHQTPIYRIIVTERTPQNCVFKLSAVCGAAGAPPSQPRMCEARELVERPASSSELVVAARRELEEALDVRALGADLARVAELLRVATAVAGECEQLATVRDAVLELFNATRDTLTTARDAARGVLRAQRDIVAGFSAGSAEATAAALEGLRANDGSAAAVAAAAAGLAQRVGAAADGAGAALEALLAARDARAHAARRGSDAAEALQRRRAEAWHSHSAILQSLSECGRLYREQASAERAAQRRATVAGLFSFVHVADRMLGDKCGFPILAPVSTYLKAVEDDAKDKAHTTLALLEAKKRQRALSRSALDDLADASRAIRAVSNDARSDEVAAESLHEAAGELRKLSASVMKVEAFWGALKESAGQLSSRSYVKLIETVGVNVAPARGNSAEVDVSSYLGWNPVGPVKRRHVQYYSRWAALEEVCAKCVEEVENAGKLAIEAEKDAAETANKESTPDEFRRRALGRLGDVDAGDPVQSAGGAADAQVEPMQGVVEQASRTVEVIDLTDDTKDGETIGREAAMAAALRAATD